MCSLIKCICRRVHENLIVAYLVKKFLSFYETQKVLCPVYKSRLQNSYFESGKSSLHLNTLFLYIYVNISFPSMARSATSHFLSGFPPKILCVLLIFSCMLHAVPIPSF
jgi:hypothetical protein